MTETKKAGRILKFRAWDKEINYWIKNPMRELFVNFYSNGGMPIFMFDQPGIASLDERGRYVIQQFTGLLDKNEKSIFEGDILNWKAHEKKTGNVIIDANAEVVWNGWCYQVKLKGYWENIFPERMKHFEIVGNVYENPELLEAQQNGD